MDLDQAKQNVGPDLDNVGPDLDPTYLALVLFLKQILKKMIINKISRWQKYTLKDASKFGLNLRLSHAKLSFHWSVKHYHMAFEWHSECVSEMSNMHFLYFSCLATDLLIFP